jgi:hypothetical protein
MNQYVLSLCACLAFFSSGSAYEEWGLPDLDAPTLIRPFAIEGRVQHQFLGRIDGSDKFDRFFGISDGADACFTLRSTVWSTAQAYVSYNNVQLFNQSRNEFVIGASYAVDLPWIFLHLQPDAQFFSYSSYRTFPEERFNNFFIQCAFRNDPIFGRVVALVDPGYDFDRKAFGLGLGLDVKVTNVVDVYGEYFPALNKSGDTLYAGRSIENPFSMGVKFTTAGHQFFLFLSNATEVGARHLMMGTLDNNLRFGFMLKRLFSFPYPWF